MGMLDRYKKKGGFNQLLQLLETSPVAKREQFLSLIGSESPAWEEALRKRVLTLNRVYTWESQYLVEVFSRLQPLTLANVMHGLPQEQIEQLLGALPPISKRKIFELISDANPSAGEKATCMSRMITEIRGFTVQGLIRLDKVDPEMSIPEDIEDTLNQSVFVAVPNFEAPSASAPEAKKDSSKNILGESDISVAQQEIEFYKRKMNQLASEVNALKHENGVLKDKLLQIKKIA